VAGQRFLVEFYTEARRRGHRQIPGFQLQRLDQQFALGGLGLTRVLLQGEIWDAGVELDAGSGADRTQGMKGNPSPIQFYRAIPMTTKAQISRP